MASAGEVPAWIGALHPRYRTPAIGSVLLGAGAAALAIVGRYDFLAAVSAGTRLLVYLACALACLRPGIGGRVRTRVTAAITSAAIVALLFGLEPHEVQFGMIGIGVGLVLYLLARRTRGGPGVNTSSREAV
jgi:APA family basic amino acid/polyamine antiporter